jgi:hypothetical protein
MLKITAPNFQDASGESKLNNYAFSGSLGRKFFKLENSGLGFEGSYFTLSLTGGTGGFRIFPAGLTSSNYDSINVSLGPGESAVFSVDYNPAWGNATGASLISSSSIYTFDENGTSTGNIIIGPTSSINFDVESNLVETKREIGSLFLEDEDGNYQVSQAYTKITEDETSFGLVRTNPKITGNVKITTDSSGDIWMNSIDATKDLSDDRFKKYRLSINSNYGIDLFNFFDRGTTPPEIVFSLYETDSLYSSTKRSLSEQYDRFYQYGVAELKSKYYDEDFSFFAPLYLKKEIPDYFVIFRTNGPINKFSYDVDFNSLSSGVTSEILANSQIVKTFDLSSSSPVGAYLRNLINHPSRKESDISVSYQQNGYTTYNGIAYEKGSFVQAGELLYDYFNQENPLISVEEFVTLGFQRNKVISSHVVNLEFLFDDATAENYSINRYFGLYVNAIDLANFSISEGGLHAFSSVIGQTPLPRKGVDGNKLSQKSFVQTNSNGISIFVENDSIQRTISPESKKIFTSTVTNFTYDINTIYLQLPGNCTSRIQNGDIFHLSALSGLTASAGATGSFYSDDYTTVYLDASTYNSTTSLSTFGSLSSLSCNFYNEEKYKLFVKDVFDNRFIQNQPRFFYVKDNKGDLHTVNNTENKSYYTDPFTSVDVIELKLKDTKLDMARMSGFSSMLTQTESESLADKGKSSLMVEILDFFSPNDYFEIYWKLGPSASGNPLRWRVQANESELNPGETWPSSILTSDQDGEYYLSYFHPGNSTIELSVFVKSIESAFNRFSFKNFQVLAKGTKLYFRSTQEGRTSESSTFKFYNQSPSIRVMGIDASNSAEVSFIGGSDRKNTRAKISTPVAQGMLTTEYISSKGSFSLAQSYSVLGEIILFAPYLEEPVYDASGDVLLDFTGCENYSVVCLSDETQPVQLTSDSKLTSYGLFKPSFGVLSSMPLRDFDTDFFFSDYTRSYTPELIEYFGRYSPPVTVTSVIGATYTFSGDLSFDSYPVSVPYLQLFNDGVDTPVLHNADSRFLFSSSGNTATLILGPTSVDPFSPLVGDVLLFMPNDKNMYFSDLELAKFKGFLALSPVVSSQDEETFKKLENLWDPNRFTFQLLDSEYDRLTENHLKPLVLKSRMVPYVNKWVSPQGKDIRDNPYRFNYHRSFGNMSFSPSSEMFTPDPRYHTHEWPYLDAVPDAFPISSFPEYAFSYMFDPLSTKYDFSSLKRDWFSTYFTMGYPTEKYMDANGNFVEAKIDPSERYSFFNYNDYNDTTTSLFRGYRFSIKEIDSDGAPINLSTKYNNYRFSVVMETEEDNSFSFEEPISFTTVVNEKWKFILIKITIRISSYRFGEGRLRYTDLYTMYNNDEKATYVYDPSAVSQEFEYREAIPTDRKLSTPINFSSYSLNNNLSNNYQYYDTFALASDNYEENLAEEIVPLKSGVYSNIVATYDSGSFYKTSILIGEPVNIFSSKTLKVSGSNAYIKLSSLITPIVAVLPTSSVEWQNFTNYHLSGGSFSYDGMRERISFAEILKVITGTSQKSRMTYEIFKEDGTTITSPNFQISPISPELLTRIYDYFPVNDPDKPQEFYDIDRIGSVLDEQKDIQSIYRYQGDFSPKFRDVLKFWVREDEDFTISTSRDFLLNNTHIGTELTDFSVVKNQYYFKVSDSEVLRLSPSSAYKPVYPLIGEIAIDKKDIFAWSSSWDQNYYQKYTDVITYSELKGTEEMKEVKSLLGSKTMKTPKQYDLYQYEIVKGTSSNLSSLTNEEIAYFEDGSYAYLRVNVYNRLLREMMGTTADSRAKSEFIKASTQVPGSFNQSLINDYAELYLKLNILDLYDISQVKLYVLETGNAGAGNISTVPTSGYIRPLIEYTTDSNGNNLSLNETDLFNRKYLEKKDTKITNLGNLSFEIKFPLDSRFYTSLSIGVVVKRI